MSLTIDFRTVSSVYNTAMSHFWGNASQMSLSSAGLLIGSGPTNDYGEMGLMEMPSGPSAGHGYGAFSFILRHERANQPGGCYALLWRADDTWLDSTRPNTFTEMDMHETWDNSVTTQSTLHYWSSSASGNNGQLFHGTTGIDMTKNHVFTLDWAPGVLTFYIDETEIYSVSGSQVPKDYADGGVNQVLGVGAETETSPVGMYIEIAQWIALADKAAAGGISGILAKLVAEAGGAATSAPTTPTAPVSPVTPPSSGSGSSGELTITAAQQTGDKLAISFVKKTGGDATLYLSAQTASTGMVGIGTYWDNCPDGTETLQPYFATVPENLTEIELTVSGTATSATFPVTQSGTTTGTGTTASTSYSWTTLSAAVVAALGSSGTSASILATIEAAFAKYSAANPGK
nr:family 16 glycosylhydrolase [uncultured Lichenicoccus sp.]